MTEETTSAPIAVPAPDPGNVRPPADNAETLQEFGDAYRAAGGGAGGTEPADEEAPAE